MEQLVDYLTGIHKENLLLYAAVTVGAIILVAITFGGLATKILWFLSIPAREGKEVV